MATRAPRLVVIGANGMIKGEAASKEALLLEGETFGFGTGTIGNELTWHLQPLVYEGTLNIPKFDIRNGNIEDAASLLVQAAIPTTFHWPIITNFVPEHGVDCVDIFIKAAMVQYDMAPPAQVAEGYRRKACIILGITRAAMCTYYRVAEADLIPGEVGVTVATMVTPVPAGGKPTFTIATGLSDAQKAIMMTDLVLDDTEKATVNALVRCGVGVPPLQGYSLIMCGHHYISEEKSQSRRAVIPVEKQNWTGQSTSTWFNNDADTTRDLVWHKSGHPLKMTLKMELAKSAKTKEMLKAADVGSAGARLPAQESELRAAGSYLALMDTVKPILQGYGGGIDTTALENAMQRVLDSENVQPTAVQVAAGVTTASIRRTAIVDLKALLDRGSGTAAFCYGFYTRMLERDAIEAGRGVTDTLKVSYALSKLPSNSTGSFHVGKLHHAAFESALNKARKTGIYEAPFMTFGTSVAPALAGTAQQQEEQ